MDLIDRQSLLRKLFPYKVVDKKNCAINAYAVEKAIWDMPNLADGGKKHSKTETEAYIDFAVKICAEIHEALESNYKARAERMAKTNVDMADEFISYCEGKIAALRGIDNFIEDFLKTLEG